MKKMNKNELNFIMQEGEGLKIEFKESFDTKSLAREIVSFANASGGRIFLGVSDNGMIKGIEVSNRLKSQIQNLARDCDPSIKIKLDSKSSVKSSVKILEIIKENSYISIPEIAEKIGLTTRAIEKNISKLKEKGLLRRVGGVKGGYWEIF